MKLLMVFWITSVFIIPVIAQEIQFEASVNRTSVSQSEPIRYLLRIISEENLSHISSPSLSVGAFHVEGPSVSTRMEMINFNTSFTRELAYDLYAKKTGKLRIGPAEILLGGKLYQTESIDV